MVQVTVPAGNLNLPLVVVVIGRRRGWVVILLQFGVGVEGKMVFCGRWRLVEDELDLLADEGGLVREVESELGLEVVDDAVNGGDGAGGGLTEEGLDAAGDLLVGYH